jgi:hypothetical protein
MTVRSRAAGTRPHVDRLLLTAGDSKSLQLCEYGLAMVCLLQAGVLDPAHVLFVQTPGTEVIWKISPRQPAAPLSGKIPPFPRTRGRGSISPPQAHPSAPSPITLCTILAGPQSAHNHELSLPDHLMLHLDHPYGDPPLSPARQPSLASSTRLLGGRRWQLPAAHHALWNKE